MQPINKANSINSVIKHLQITFKVSQFCTKISIYSFINLISYIFHAMSNIQIRIIPTYCNVI